MNHGQSATRTRTRARARRAGLAGWCVLALLAPLPRAQAQGTAPVPDQDVESDEEDPAGAEEYLGPAIDLADLINLTTSIATRSPVSVLEAPGTVLVFTDEDIRRFGWKDLREVLAAVPNMDLLWQWNWLAGGQRGFTGNFSGTLLLIDGREVQNLLADEAFITSAFTSHRIKRIEILEGPNSTLYGANAIEGIINIVTKHGPDGVDGASGSYLQGEVGTRQLGGSIRASGLDYSLGLSASYFTSRQNWPELAQFNADDRRYSRDPGIDAFRVHDPGLFDIPEESYSIDGYAQYRGVYAGVNLFRTINSEGLEIINWNFNAHESRRGTRQLFAGVKRELFRNFELQLEYRNISEVDSTLSLYPQNQETWMSPADVDLRVGADLIQIHRHRAGAQLDVRVGAYNHFVVGYDFLSTDYLSLNQLNAIQPGRGSEQFDLRDQRDQSFFMEDTLSTVDRRLQLVLGLRYTSPWNTRPTVLPRASLIWKVSNSAAVKLTYGQGYRGPNVFEQEGSPDLPPINMEMYEVNYTHQHTFDSGFELTSIAVGYAMRLRNQYASVQTPDGLSANVVVQSVHQVRGVEQMLQLHFRGLRAFAGARYVQPDPRIVAGQRIVNDVPRLKVKTGLSVQPVRYLLGSVFLDHWSSVATDANRYGQPGQEIYTVPSWLVLHGFLRAGDFHLSAMRASVGLYVENITDRTYYHANTRGTSPVQFIQAPRNFRLQATLSF